MATRRAVNIVDRIKKHCWFKVCVLRKTDEKKNRPLGHAWTVATQERTQASRPSYLLKATAKQNTTFLHGYAALLTPSNCKHLRLEKRAALRWAKADQVAWTLWSRRKTVKFQLSIILPPPAPPPVIKKLSITHISPEGLWKTWLQLLHLHSWTLH